MTKSKEVRERLLKEFEAGLNITDACAQAGISRETYYRWLEESGDEGEWTLDCKSAQSIQRAKMTNVLIEQGLQGDWRSAFTYLKSVAPADWGERREVDINVTNAKSDGDDLVKDMIEQLRYELVADNESDDDDDDATIDP